MSSYVLQMQQGGRPTNAGECYKCHKPLSSAESIFLQHGDKRRCDECVIADMEDSEEDYDDSQDEPTELKLSSTAKPLTPEELDQARRNIHTIDKCCTCGEYLTVEESQGMQEGEQRRCHRCS